MFLFVRHFLTSLEALISYEIKGELHHKGLQSQCELGQNFCKKVSTSEAETLYNKQMGTAEKTKQCLNRYAIPGASQYILHGVFQ